MTPPLFDGLEHAHAAVLAALLGSGSEVAPRGLTTTELPAVSFTLRDPRRRCLQHPARRWSLPLALGELCWHLSGNTKVDALTPYAPAWKAFASDDGNIRGSCYGARIFQASTHPSPWQLASELLRRDQASRRAVLYFNDTHSPVFHLEPGCRDAPCAASLQFLARGGRLDAIVHMRSNDAIWGLPYDVFLFTFLQELMSIQLGLPLGTYTHFAGSMHIYSKHTVLAKRILYQPQGNADFVMPRLVEPEAVSEFARSEELIRMGRPVNSGMAPYWMHLLEVLSLYHSSRVHGWASVIDTASNSPYWPVLAPLTKPGLPAAEAAVAATASS